MAGEVVDPAQPEIKLTGDCDPIPPLELYDEVANWNNGSWEAKVAHGRIYRVHEIPRAKAFVPSSDSADREAGAPRVAELSDHCVQLMWFADGTQDIVEDNWRQQGESEYKDMRTWVGETWFIPRGPREQVDRALTGLVKRLRRKTSLVEKTPEQPTKDYISGVDVDREDLVSGLPAAALERAFLSNAQRECKDFAALWQSGQKVKIGGEVKFVTCKQASRLSGRR